MSYREYHVNVGEVILFGENQDNQVLTINIFDIDNNKVKFKISSSSKYVELFYENNLFSEVVWDFGNQKMEGLVSHTVFIDKNIGEKVHFKNNDFIIVMSIENILYKSVSLKFSTNHPTIRIYSDEINSYSLSWWDKIHNFNNVGDN